MLVSSDEDQWNVNQVTQNYGERNPMTEPTIAWPNQNPVVDGVTPVSDVSQDPEMFSEVDDTEMED
jgi:hypothetical protein